MVLPACLLACLRTTWAKEHAGRVCLLAAHAFLPCRESLSPFKPSVLLTRRRLAWVNISVDDLRVTVIYYAERVSCCM